MAAVDGVPHVPLAGGDARLDVVQGTRDRRCAAPRLGIEADVAARHGESVRLAHRRADLDARRDVEVAHETTDDERLLRVLLPEERVVGLHHVEQLRHDGGDASEVLGAAHRSLERCRQARDLHRRGEARRIDLLGVRREEEVDAGAPRELGVARLVARIAREVGRIVELRRVHEERDDDETSTSPRGRDA